MPMTTDMKDDLPLLDLDVTAQAELVRAGRATPEDLLEAAFARMGRLNPQLNAPSAKDVETARRRVHNLDAKAPFVGVPC